VEVELSVWALAKLITFTSKINLYNGPLKGDDVINIILIKAIIVMPISNLCHLLVPLTQYY
jgi:hypothetical protein